MTIGEQLKKERKLLGLSQAEMAAGVVSESFYSRVERDQNEITIEDLLALLNKHQINLADFFANFDRRDNFAAEVKQAWLKSDIGKLKDLADDSNLTKRQKLLVRLALAVAQGKSAKLSAAEKQAMKQAILHVGNWNSETLWQLALLLPFYDWQEVRLLLNSVAEQYEKEGFVNQEKLLALSEVLLAYLKRCYQAEKMAELHETIKLIEKLPHSTATFGVKLVADYYQSWCQKDKEKVEQIKEMLRISGYQNLLKTLPG